MEEDFVDVGPTLFVKAKYRNKSMKEMKKGCFDVELLKDIVVIQK